jgi:hypothetical protein
VASLAQGLTRKNPADAESMSSLRVRKLLNLKTEDKS